MQLIRKEGLGIPGLESRGRVDYLVFPGLAATGAVRHLFTTRLGGVSKGHLGSMNVSYTRGDEKENVDENYRRIAEIMDCSTADFVCTHQTHTANIRIVDYADAGKGVVCPTDYQDVDGLVTNCKGLVLTAFFADCVPLFFLDPVREVIGLCHSGWRGTVAGIGGKAVEVMSKHFGCRREDVLAAIGPSICQDCYEVSEDVAQRFAEKFRITGDMGKANHILKTAEGYGKKGKYLLDLWQANRQVLLDAGVLPEHIEVTDLCTCCNSEWLFSHRASEGKRGNLGAFIKLL